MQIPVDANLSNNKVYIETFGCQMNVSDSERIATHLALDNFEIVADQSAAAIVLLNTCSVREKAEHKLYTRIGEIRAQRVSNQPLIGVLGCVAQLEGETLLAADRKIDFVVGTKANGRVGPIIRQVLSEKKKRIDLDSRENSYDWNVTPSQRHSKYVAFVPVIEGCNKFCTYCIVPFARGREESRTAAQIIREISRLRDEGVVREIHLIGQNVNSYRPRLLDGLEKFGGATLFAKLLRAVAATGIERIKFTTSFPRDFHADLVSAINEFPNLCNWVHLPVQSGSDRILRAMRRGHLVSDYLKHVDLIKSSERPISLTSDIIVGFPGETREDHEATLRLIKQCEFDSLYLFKYSERPGTPAAGLADDVSAIEKQERFQELEQAQREVQQKLYQNCLGQIFEVLAERPSVKNSAELSGHSTCHKVVNFSLDSAIGEATSVQLGQIYPVRVTASKSNSLYGVAV